MDADKHHTQQIYYANTLSASTESIIITVITSNDQKFHTKKNAAPYTLAPPNIITRQTNKKGRAPKGPALSLF